MIINAKKSKITLNKLAGMTAREFSTVRKDMNKGFVELRGDMRELRGDMQNGFSMMRKDITGEVLDIVREGNINIVASNEKVASKLDEFLKDRGAHDALHKRITDELHYHDQRVKKLEVKV
ncbi:MAG: hypothetical protein UV01_C0011G0034 [Parcubacteria group bacterium GW2011_GWA2_42_14]|nr:MAG: hypothetical protein UV01_C0011G0034 [Parcubacteria group bacterium GW2011_GWA2_42_14]